MKGDEPAMKYQKVLIFIAGLTLFICDLMIKVSNIKEIPSILTIDFKFFKKIQIELFIRKTSPHGFLRQVCFPNFRKEKRREKQTVNMPRQYFDIREDNSFPFRLESIPVFLIYQMQDIRRKIGSKIHRKKLMIN